MKSKSKICITTGIVLILTLILIENNSANSNSEKYLINKNGKTYGTNKVDTIGYEPDLMLAKGDDGTVGYVRTEELNDPEFKTPEEAIAWQNSKPSYRVLSLYDEDEENIIGTFTIGR
ncbi:MAG: hypothetical protein ACLTBU_00050 [Zhenhengia sp.]|uniref:hypothetical protein n=1 Tax=Zhenhengia sp. TaxID=2944208 RepID=UPI00399189D7